jgi:hypothetical protein
MADTLTTRQQRSELERVAQVAMNKAREAQRLESRKRDLPITSARPLGTKQFIRDIETARREGHQVSEVTPATEKQAVAPQTEKSGTEIFADMVASGQIGKDAVYDSYDKATGKVSYHIPGKPKTGWQIFDEMLASKELPSNAVYQGYDSATGTLNYYLRPELYLFRASMPDGSTIDIYAKTQTEAKAIAKAKGAYTITVRMIPTDPKNTPELFSKRVFANMQATGDIPKEAVYAGYDKATDTFQYSMPDTRTGQQIFNDMQTKGEIPKDAAFESYTAATGEVTYRLPDTRTVDEVFNDMIAAGDIPKGAILNSFNAETRELTYVEPVAQTSQGLFAIDESKLTGEIFGIKSPGLERAAAQINRLFEIFAPKVDASLFKEPKQFVLQTAKAVASYMPLVWAVNWKSMSKQEKIINGAIDAVILVTLGLGQGLRALKAQPIVKAATTAGKAADTMDGAVKVLAKTPMDDVAKYAKASSTASKAIQASKVADAKFIVQLEKVKSLTVSQLATLEKASGIKGLKSAILKVSKAQTQLTKAWKPVSTMKLGGDKYIAQMTKVATAQTKLATALETFNSKLKPRYTFTASPEFKGFATEWRKRILPTFTGGQPVVAPLGRGGKGVQLAVLEKTKPKLELQTVYEMKLKPVHEIAKTVKAKVAAPTVKEVAEKVIAKAVTSGVARKLASISSDPVVVRKVQTIIDKATKTAIDLYVAGSTASQVYTSTEANIRQMVATIAQNQIRTSLQEKTVIQTMTKAATQTASKVATQTKVALRTSVETKTQEKTRLETKIKLRPTIKDKDGKERPMTDAELAGAAAWKQGFTYIMRYPPYGKDDIQYSSTPFPGVKTLEGIGSAYKTIVRLGGKLPATIKTDMGIMDIDIKTRQGKPVLSFAVEGWHRPRRFTPRRPIARRRKSELQLSIAR